MSEAMAAKVFISYRRNDVRYQARDIYEAFCKAIPSDDVFMDVDSIRPGYDFQKILKDWVNKSELVLALIGPAWIDARDPKTKARRLDDPSDFVRIEIGEALARDIPVVPVLIDGTPMPDVGLLPKDLKGLVDRQAEFVEYRTFDTDVQRLIKKLGLSPQTAVTATETRTFYRRLNQNLTELDWLVHSLAGADVRNSASNPATNSLLWEQTERLASAVKPVCEARLKVSELGDTAILQQLNQLCLVLDSVGGAYGRFTGAASVVIAAQAALELGLLKKLQDNVALKA
jgi:hypothetical protein